MDKQFLFFPKNHPHAGGFYFYNSQSNLGYLPPNSNQTNGGVRGGTWRLLLVDSKAEATQYTVPLTHSQRRPPPN
ncbi:hypothetical protein ACK38V_14635 [Aeromonas veronii]